MESREKLTIARILKVNHAGEYGAIRIYRAQIWVASLRYPDIASRLAEFLDHEITHCRAFREAMPERDARPCRIMALWGNGGFILGFLTALLGRRGIWVCTAAVEAAVHRHLDDQLVYLRRRDPELHALIHRIQEEELQHLSLAEQQIDQSGRYPRLLSAVITGATDMAIWLSTWGDSSRMSKELAAANPAD